jgi:hypothetical protein
VKRTHPNMGGVLYIYNNNTGIYKRLTLLRVYYKFDANTYSISLPQSQIWETYGDCAYTPETMEEVVVL